MFFYRLLTLPVWKINFSTNIYAYFIILLKLIQRTTHVIGWLLIWLFFNHVALVRYCFPTLVYKRQINWSIPFIIQEANIIVVLSHYMTGKHNFWQSNAHCNLSSFLVYRNNMHCMREAKYHSRLFFSRESYYKIQNSQNITGISSQRKLTQVSEG